MKIKKCINNRCKWYDDVHCQEKGNCGCHYHNRGGSLTLSCPQFIAEPDCKVCREIQKRNGHIPIETVMEVYRALWDNRIFSCPSCDWCGMFSEVCQTSYVRFVCPKCKKYKPDEIVLEDYIKKIGGQNA